MMPVGETKIFEYLSDLENPVQVDGFETMKEVFLFMGPENYLTYTVDCYQLYLWYCGFGDRPLAGSVEFLEFVMEILKYPRIKIINNWRYEINKIAYPAQVRPFLGKMFLGIRHNPLKESGSRRHY